jgi:hypothetical protein
VTKEGEKTNPLEAKGQVRETKLSRERLFKL